MMVSKKSKFRRQSKKLIMQMNLCNITSRMTFYEAVKGKIKEKVDPLPGSLSTQIFPL